MGSKKSHPFAYIPFSHGPRHYFGTNLEIHFLKISFLKIKIKIIKLSIFNLYFSKEQYANWKIKQLYRILIYIFDPDLIMIIKG